MLDNGRDYRTASRNDHPGSTSGVPHDARVAWFTENAAYEAFWDAVCGAPGAVRSDALALHVDGRRIDIPNAVRWHDGTSVCRISYARLAESAAFGKAGFQALLDACKVVCLTGIPQVDPAEQGSGALRNLISFVDLAYDMRARVVFECATGVDDVLARVAPTAPSTAGVTDLGFADTLDVHIGGAGSSGRSTLYFGDVEWSATGRKGASLDGGSGASFAAFAAARCQSRLSEMATARYWAPGGGAMLRLLADLHLQGARSM